MAEYAKVNEILKKYDSNSKGAMEAAIATLPKTKFWWRNMFHSTSLRIATTMTISCLITSVVYWQLVLNPTNKKYAAVKRDSVCWKKYQDFERKRALGMFRSCPPDGQERKFSW